MDDMLDEMLNELAEMLDEMDAMDEMDEMLDEMLDEIIWWRFVGQYFSSFLGYWWLTSSNVEIGHQEFLAHGKNLAYLKTIPFAHEGVFFDRSLPTVPSKGYEEEQQPTTNNNCNNNSEIGFWGCRRPYP